MNVPCRQCLINIGNCRLFVILFPFFNLNWDKKVTQSCTFVFVSLFFSLLIKHLDKFVEATYKVIVLINLIHNGSDYCLFELLTDVKT